MIYLLLIPFVLVYIIISYIVTTHLTNYVEVKKAYYELKSVEKSKKVRLHITTEFNYYPHIFVRYYPKTRKIIFNRGFEMSLNYMTIFSPVYVYWYLKLEKLLKR